jgi:hypothetical protein
MSAAILAERADQHGGLRKLLPIGLGHALYYAFNVAFDGILYVYVVHTHGLLKGGIAMTVIAALINVAMLLWYQHMKVDWVGGGYVQGLVGKSNPNLMERLMVWAHEKNSFLIFAVLNIVQDPFVATAYFKKGDFGRLTGKDWRCLLASIAFANFYWTFVAAGIGIAVARVWSLLL